MRVIFAGTPQTAVPSLEELLRSKHEVVAVLTRPDAAAGRGRHVGPSKCLLKKAMTRSPRLRARPLSRPTFLAWVDR